ncbi:MAG: glycosyltransferase family 4 protein [Pseudomonadota bacterium]
MKWRGAKLIFDYDDALFIKKSSRYNVLATLFRSSRKIIDLFRLSDCVIAGNDWLRDAAVEHGGHAVTVEVAEDTCRIAMRPPHNEADGVLIGWLGSKSTVKYLRLIEPVLRRIFETYPNVRFEIVGGGHFELDGLPVTHTDWSLEEELRALRRFDIGLMPLPIEDWAKGKSGGKARTYMAAGVPPVCAKIGYNIELIEPGVTGYLCTNEDDWFETLSQLIEDAGLRQEIGRAARADVVERFSPHKQAKKILDVCLELLTAAEPGEARSVSNQKT